MNQNSKETPFPNESFAVVRAPIDQKTGRPFEACSYALFPGITLAQSEPKLVVLLYDSLLHQHPDTAMFLYKGYGSDPLLNRKYQQRLLSQWRALGKPTVILTTPEDRKFFRGSLGEVPTGSLYDELIANSISGGCSRELFRLSEPEEYGFRDAVAELADNMGAVIYDPESSNVNPADVSRIPFLTSSIEVRNSMKKRGFDAVHILELIYGMGDSNTHLAHVHAKDHEHSHEAPQVRETTQSPAEFAATEALFDEQAKKKNLQDLHDALLAFFWGE